MHPGIILCDDLSPEYLQKIEHFLDEWNAAEPTLEVSTSGSTGKPKIIHLLKSRVRESARATGRFFNFQPGQTVLLNLSPDYIAGKLMIVRALEHGMKILVAPNQQNPLLNVKGHKIDFGAFVPYQVEAILKNETTRKVYESITNVIIGGAPVSYNLEQGLLKCVNANYATFGMTETITHFALRDINRKAVFYTCLPGFKIDQDERGCLEIEKNKISDRLITNDIIDKIDDTHFIWKGRLDFVVNSGGVKLSPELLERKVNGILSGLDYFFFGRKSEKFGEELVLYIEGEKPENWSSIESRLGDELERFERPKAILFIPQFDKTATGKLIRKNYN